MQEHNAKQNPLPLGMGRVNKELKKLLKYCENNNIKVIFTDSGILHDYGAMNPEAAKTMGFPDIDNNPETKEILIDKTLPKETQIANLKHELIEMRLKQDGMEYWQAHLEALRREEDPFDFSQPMNTKEINIIPVDYGGKRWHRRFTSSSRLGKLFSKKKPKSAQHIGILRVK